MKFLADENFPLTSVLVLEQAGFDIKSIIKELPGISDDEVINLAIKENRTLITFDRDFGELIFKKGYQPRSGIIYLRWEDYLPDEPGEYLKAILLASEIEFENKLTVVTRNNIRQKAF